ncbi:MAG: hypothetical protein ACE5HO_15935 [bacterium]
MTRKANTKARQRFVMYIPNDLRREIETWASQKGITLAEFGREAFESYLHAKRREERHAQLAETCQMLAELNDQVAEKWGITDAENWPT